MYARSLSLSLSLSHKRDGYHVTNGRVGMWHGYTRQQDASRPRQDRAGGHEISSHCSELHTI